MLNKIKLNQRWLLFMGIILFASLLSGCGSSEEEVKSLPIPADAGMIIKIKNSSETIAKLKERAFFKNLKKFEGFDNFMKAVAGLDTAGSENSGQRLLAGKTFTLSVHPANDNSSGLIAYFKLNDEETKRLKTLRNNLENSRAFRLEDHEYEGITITEIKDLKTEKNYSIAKISNLLIITPTAHLAEDVIRQHSEGNKGSISTVAPASLPASDSVDAELIVDYKNFPALLHTFTDAGSELFSTFIGKLSGNSYLEYKAKEGRVAFTGFTLPGKNPGEEFLHTLKGQSPQNFRLKNILPGTAASVLYFGFSRPETFNSALMKYWDANNIPMRAERTKMREQLPHGPEKLFEEMAGEAALCNMELFSEDSGDKLLYVEVKNPRKADTLLLQMAEAMAREENDIVFREYYKNRIIRETGLSEVPYILFGLPFAGFGATFYTTIDNYVVFGNSVQSLKNLVDLIERDHVWGKSEKHIKFLEGVFDESNFSFFADVEKNQKLLTTGLKKNHQNFLNENSGNMTMFDMISVQYSDVENMFFTGIMVSHRDSKTAKSTSAAAPGNFSKEDKSFTHTVPFKLSVRYVPNSTNNKLFVQDIENRLVCLDDNLKVVWSAENIGELKNSPIHLPDLYANGKIQFLFAAGDKIHCYDRLGNKVEGFPFAVGLPAPPEGVSMFDYDYKKDYRLMMYDKYGKIKLTDKTGQTPAGWQGAGAGTGLIDSPIHTKVKFNDIIAYADANGKVYAIGRRGENKEGFPVNLSAACTGPVHFSKGSELSTSYLTLLTNNGELCRISLNGKVASRKQLVKPDAGTKFSLLTAHYGSSYAIVRKTGASVEFLDAGGQSIFSQGFRNENLQFRYFDFGGSGKLFEVHDPTLLRSYLFGSKGEMLTEYTASGLSEVKETKPHKFVLYRMFGNKLIAESFGY